MVGLAIGFACMLFALIAVAAIVATACPMGVRNFERQISQNQNPPIASVGRLIFESVYFP